MTPSKEERSGRNQIALCFEELSEHFLHIGLTRAQIVLVLTLLLSLPVPVASAENGSHESRSQAQSAGLQLRSPELQADLDPATLEALLHILEQQQQAEYGPPQNLPEPFGSAPPDELSMTALGEALGIAVIQPTEEPDGSFRENIGG